METDLSFCSLCEKMDTVSVCILATAAPLDFRRPPTTSGFPPLPVNFFTVAKEKALLIYYLSIWVMPGRTAAYCAALDGGGSERGAVTAEKLSL